MFGRNFSLAQRINVVTNIGTYTDLQLMTIASIIFENAGRNVFIPKYNNLLLEKWKTGFYVIGIFNCAEFLSKLDGVIMFTSG